MEIHSKANRDQIDMRWRSRALIRAGPTGILPHDGGDSPPLFRRHTVIAQTSMTKFAILAAATLLGAMAQTAAATGPSPQALAAFDQYLAHAEAKIHHEESAQDTFLGTQAFPAPSPADLKARLRRGEIIVTSGGITPVEVPGGLIHHWIGLVFIPQATISQLFAVLQNYDQMARYYSPDVAASHIVKRHGDNFQVSIRLREHKVVTVMLDGLYDIRYGELDDRHQYSVSHSMQMVEVSGDRDPGLGEAAGEDDPSGSGADHGFLWRTNAYWRFEQANDGVFVEFESISLSRDVPAGWGWLIEPFIREVPRESLVFTLRATRKAVLENSVSASAQPEREDEIRLHHRP
jgi:hypothetical protein